MPTRRDVAAYCDAIGRKLGAARQIAELNADLVPRRSVPVEQKLGLWESMFAAAYPAVMSRGFSDIGLAEQRLDPGDVSLSLRPPQAGGLEEAHS